MLVNLRRCSIYCITAVYYCFTELTELALLQLCCNSVALTALLQCTTALLQCTNALLQCLLLYCSAALLQLYNSTCCVSAYLRTYKAHLIRRRWSNQVTNATSVSGFKQLVYAALSY
jgi:hypothetical protein